MRASDALDDAPSFGTTASKNLLNQDDEDEDEDEDEA